MCERACVHLFLVCFLFVCFVFNLFARFKFSWALSALGTDNVITYACRTGPAGTSGGRRTNVNEPKKKYQSSFCSARVYTNQNVASVVFIARRALQKTSSVDGRGSARTQLEELTSFPQTSYSLQGI